MKANNSSVIFLVLAALRYLEAAAAPAEQEQAVEFVQVDDALAPLLVEQAVVEASEQVQAADFELASDSVEQVQEFVAEEAQEEVVAEESQEEVVAEESQEEVVAEEAQEEVVAVVEEAQQVAAEELVALPVVDESFSAESESFSNEFVIPAAEEQVEEVAAEGEQVVDAEQVVIEQVAEEIAPVAAAEEEQVILKSFVGEQAQEAELAQFVGAEQAEVAQQVQFNFPEDNEFTFPESHGFSLAAFGHEDDVYQFDAAAYQYDFQQQDDFQAGQQAGVEVGEFTFKNADLGFDSPIFESEQQQQVDAQEGHLKSLNLGAQGQGPKNAGKQINLQGLNLLSAIQNDNVLLSQLGFCDLSTLGALFSLRSMSVFYPVKANSEERYRTAAYVQALINNFPCDRERNIMMQVANQYPPIFSSQKLYDSWVQMFAKNILQQINSPLSGKILNFFAQQGGNMAGMPGMKPMNKKQHKH